MSLSFANPRHWFASLPLPHIEEAVLPGINTPIHVLRDDAIGGVLSGNKARKLKYPLIGAHDQRLRGIVTMGGAHSNHLYAVAHAGRIFDFATHAYVRLHPQQRLTPTLNDCVAQGMHLHRLSREDYRALRTSAKVLQDDFKDYLWLPEGGSSVEALKGVRELGEMLPKTFSRILLAAGTGATAAGIATGLNNGEVWAIPVLKNGAHLRGEVQRLVHAAGTKPKTPVRWLTQYHEGGYGKVPPMLQRFCTAFNAQNAFVIEPIYTGKVFFAAQQLLMEGTLTLPHKLLIIHTGGLQGARASMNLNWS